MKVGLKKFIRTRFKHVMKGSKEHIVIFGNYLWLVCVRETSDNFFNLFLRHFVSFFVVNLDPSRFLALWIGEGSKAINVGLDGLVRFIIAKSLLKKAEFGLLGDA